MKILSSFAKTEKKKFALLIDPDKKEIADYAREASLAATHQVDYIFVGGSLLTRDNMEECVKAIKDNCDIPVILFPGNTNQVTKLADGIFFLSLISGRNPEMLIGKHVMIAPLLRNSNLEIISTGYLLIDGGKVSSAQYMSNSTPIPADKFEIAACTAMAGEMLGFKAIYIDAGSGAPMPIKPAMIKRIKKNISIPLIVGGGIRNATLAVDACGAGADIIVVGNAIEKDDLLIASIANAIHSFK